MNDSDAGVLQVMATILSAVVQSSGPTASPQHLVKRTADLTRALINEAHRMARAVDAATDQAHRAALEECASTSGVPLDTKWG